MDDRILLDAGSGGRASQRLISQCFMRHFSNPLLDRMDDAALLDIKGPLAMSTDSYTVTPLFFAGGSIGTLAVHGTVNDVAMLGARPRYLSCACIIDSCSSLSSRSRCTEYSRFCRYSRVMRLKLEVRRPISSLRSLVSSTS